MRLTKHHSFGNDFLVALVDRRPATAASLAARLCDRRRGVGADGLIFGLPPDGPQDHEIEFRLYNSDGSEAEVSGNGLRCLGQALLRAGRVDESGDVRVLTPAGRRLLRVTGGPSDVEISAEVEMGSVRPVAAVGGEIDRALAATAPGVRRWAALEIGNPHVVVEVDRPDLIDLAIAGPAVEAAAGPTNVHFVGARDGGLEMAIWERGAGVTEACGSGACVAAWASRGWGLIAANSVEVSMPGGVAVVELGSDDTVTLTGPVVFIATIEVPDDEPDRMGAVR